LEECFLVLTLTLYESQLTDSKKAATAGDWKLVVKEQKDYSLFASES
jgi:hypothetical protein